jgi:hypothetical protein
MEPGPGFREPMSRPRCRRGSISEFEDGVVLCRDAVTKGRRGAKSNAVIDCQETRQKPVGLSARRQLGTVKVRTEREAGNKNRGVFGSQTGPKLENCGAVEREKGSRPAAGMCLAWFTR